MPGRDPITGRFTALYSDTEDKYSSLSDRGLNPSRKSDSFDSAYKDRFDKGLSDQSTQRNLSRRGIGPAVPKRNDYLERKGLGPSQEFFRSPGVRAAESMRRGSQRDKFEENVSENEFRKKKRSEPRVYPERQRVRDM